MSEQDDYGFRAPKQSTTIAAPQIEYRPPTSTQPHRIGLIGTGSISEFHLRNYVACGYEVVAMASRTRSKAEARRAEFYPNATVHDDYQSLLAREDIDVVDITPHPEDRLPILRHAIDAGKHVLSQKPFVLDLGDGKDLIERARNAGTLLAVNQNGRWAPHFSYIRNAVSSGIIGDVTSIDFSLQWDHTWIAGNEAFENIKHLLLIDFGIHWFDIVCCMTPGQKPKSVFASVTRTGHQVYAPPSLATVVVEFEHSQARLSFNAHTTLGEEDTTTVVGTKGTLRSRGPSLNEQPAIDLFLEEGQCSVPLEGCWFESGFRGTMGELLCAIDERREPYHSAENCLGSLEMCFAAIQSAETGQPVEVGRVVSLP